MSPELRAQVIAALAANEAARDAALVQVHQHQGAINVLRELLAWQPPAPPPEPAPEAAP